MFPYSKNSALSLIGGFMAKAHTLLSVNFLTDRKPICNGILQDAFCTVDPDR